MGNEPTGPSHPPATSGSSMPPSFEPRVHRSQEAAPHPDRHRGTGGHDGPPGTVPEAMDATSEAGPVGSDLPRHRDRAAVGDGHGDGDHAPGGQRDDAADGDREGRRRRSRRLRTTASIVVVTVASGLLFSLSAISARESAGPEDAGLVGLVRHQQDTVDQLMSGNQDLQQRIDTLVASSAATPAPTPTSVLELSKVAVTGPGLTVTLTDAPAGVVPDGARVDDLVVHQQDIENVMNALWAGGAEAMTVQGVRVSSRTVIRCIGNVILVDGARFSPPYVISAIGEPDALRDALSANRSVTTYLGYVARYQLGWEVDVDDDLQFDAVTQEPGIKYAQVVDHG